VLFVWLVKSIELSKKIVTPIKTKIRTKTGKIVELAVRDTCMAVR